MRYKTEEMIKLMINIPDLIMEDEVGCKLKMMKLDNYEGEILCWVDNKRPFYVGVNDDGDVDFYTISKESKDIIINKYIRNVLGGDF